LDTNGTMVEVRNDAQSARLESGIDRRILPHSAYFAYNHPILSKINRPASQIEFAATSATLPLTLWAKVANAIGSRISARRTPYCPPHHPLPAKTPDIQTFLQQKPTQLARTEFLSHRPRSEPRLEFILSDFIGQGRTGKVWHAGLCGSGARNRWVAKVISARELACVVRETLFYQCVFPGSTLGQLVPRYYGTYASCDGGCQMKNP